MISKLRSGIAIDDHIVQLDKLIDILISRVDALETRLNAEVAILRRENQQLHADQAHWELGNCPDCPNVTSLQEALEQNAKLRERCKYVGFKIGKVHEEHIISEYYCGGCGWPVTDHDSYCPECGGAFRESDANLGELNGRHC